MVITPQHKLRVMHLYRHSLKHLMSWAIRRNVFADEVRERACYSPFKFPALIIPRVPDEVWHCHAGRESARRIREECKCGEFALASHELPSHSQSASKAVCSSLWLLWRYARTTHTRQGGWWRGGRRCCVSSCTPTLT